MKIIKNFFLISLATIICFLSVPITPVSASYTPPFEINSKAAFLVNLDTDTILFQKDADTQYYPASLTKIMTAIVAIEYAQANNLDMEKTMITAPKYIYNEFAGLGVSTADIRAGETVSLLDLLYALILPSSCEAASIIADYIGQGQIVAFVEMMNKKAAELGAKNTVFKNPHGLYDNGQVTTARDMYLITKYALTFPVFEKICSTTTYKMPVTPIHPNDNWYIHHTNKMMVKGTPYYYKDLKGVKTGTLDEVGRNLITTVSKNNYTYLLVTIGAPMNNDKNQVTPYTAYEDATNLYNWAYKDFSLQKVINADEIVAEIPVALSSSQDYVSLATTKDISTLLPKDTDQSALLKDIKMAQNVKAPIKKGDVLGQIDLKIADDIIATAPLVAVEDVNRNFLLYISDMTFQFLSRLSTKILLIVLGVLVLLYIIFLTRYRRFKRLRNARYRRAHRQ